MRDEVDAVLESLPVISHKGHRLKAAAAFSSWFFTVIKRECRKLERAMFRRESLAAHYLEAVLLRDFEELTIADIAERHGEPPGAIKSRLHSARELVREYMISPKAFSD